MPAMPAIIEKVKTFFKPRPVKRIAQMLYLECVARARLPVFYLDYGIDDAIGARFELLTFHIGLVVTHLKSAAASDPRREQAAETGQALFDAFLLALDSTLREQGVGDLTVPKKMKKLGIVIYTRMKRWDDLRTEPIETQADYAARTLYAGAGYDGDDEGDALGEDIIPSHIVEQSRAFAAYAQSAREALTIDDILAGRIGWPTPAELEVAPDSLNPDAAN